MQYLAILCNILQYYAMKFPPTYIRTSTIAQHLYDLDVLKAANNLRPISETTIRFLREASILKSSLFSARIEGNPLTLNDVRHLEIGEAAQDTHVKEITNLTTAYESLALWNQEQLSRELLKKIHDVVMNGLTPVAGKFRMEESAIFNQAGVAVYLPPAPQNIPNLLDALVHWVSDTTDSAPVISAVAHVWFEKIHPFDDGNGRVGRLLSTLLLAKGGYGFGGIVPFEEYLENHRGSYYEALGRDLQDVTSFVEFFLEAIAHQIRKSLAEVEKAPKTQYPNLLPRRVEIVEIIHDHKLVSFNFLSRRFRKIPTRTLHNDIARLIEAGYVRRLGTTRGALYAPGDKA